MGNQVPRIASQRAVGRCKTVSVPRDNSSPQHSAEKQIYLRIRPQRVLPLQRNVLLDTDRAGRAALLHGVKKSGTAKKRTSSLLYSKLCCAKEIFLYFLLSYPLIPSQKNLFCKHNAAKRKESSYERLSKVRKTVFSGKHRKSRMDEKGQYR